jgi:hypothetical protein
VAQPAVAEWHGRRPRVEQRSAGEALAQAVAHQPQTVEVRSSGARGGLRLDRDDGAVASFEDHVDLVPVPVAKVKGARRIGIDARLAHDLHHDERLDQRSGDLRVAPGAGARERRVFRSMAVQVMRATAADRPCGL